MAAKKKKIMECFPNNIAPRPVQEHSLLALEKIYSKSDVIVLNLPVASGKSACAITLARWSKGAAIITPTKLLVDQYSKEYPHVHVLRAKSDYWCDSFGVPLSKRPATKSTGKTCKAAMGCNGCTTYKKDLRKAYALPTILGNYYIYMAHNLYRDTLIVDEAHSLIPTLKDLASKKFWKFKYKMPEDIDTVSKLKEWINNLPPSSFYVNYSPDGESKTQSVENSLKELKDEINSSRPRYIVSFEKEKYKGEYCSCVKLSPVDITDHMPVMWPASVKKIIFMSATISRKDIEQLGLANRKVQYIQADSPIQAERRPVIVPPEAKNMSYKYQQENLPHLRDFITKIAKLNKESKGLIHATYSLAAKLKELEWDPSVEKRLIFHTNKDKSKKYLEFRESNDDKIIIASGMYEGIDLPYDAGRWQVIAKIPWPSLADPATKYLASKDKEFYAWETIKQTLQACGRICRTPTDFGKTYIFDVSFKRLYNNNSDLIPKWFKSSVKGI